MITMCAGQKLDALTPAGLDALPIAPTPEMAIELAGLLNRHRRAKQTLAKVEAEITELLADIEHRHARDARFHRSFIFVLFLVCSVFVLFAFLFLALA
jgi:hypothetical protein